MTVSNPHKNRLINISVKPTDSVIEAVLFKELGDVMQSVTYMAFVKIMENLKNPSDSNTYPINMPSDLFTYIQKKVKVILKN